MGSASPPGETPIAGIVRVTNGVKIPEQESRFHRLSAPTGPRAGVKPRRPSPDRNGAIYRRDWTSPDNNGGLGYRDRDVIEKNWRKHPDNSPRHIFKHVADTYRPGHFPSCRSHIGDESSRSPPLWQGGGNTDNGYVLVNRSRDPTSNQAPQERSRSPLQRAREAAREVADRIVRDSLNNLPKAGGDGIQSQKRVEPPERNQTDLATATRSDIAHNSDARATFCPSSYLSQGLPGISQHRDISSGRDSVTGNNSSVIPRLVKTQSTNGEPAAISDNSPTAILSASVIDQGNGIGDSSNVQPPLFSVTERNASSGTTTNSILPPKPPVIQSPNLSYEDHPFSGPLKSQQASQLQPPVEDARSVVSDLTVATRKSTSSLSSASVASWEAKLRTCHVCKGYISSEYDLGIRCSACKHHFHRRCEQGANSEITQEGVMTWRCSRCTKTQRAPSHQNTTPIRSGFDPSFYSSRQSPAPPTGPKTAVVNADGQPPRKRLRTDASDFAIAMPVSDIFDAQHSFEAIAKGKYVPTPSTDGFSEPVQDPHNPSGNAALSTSRHHTGNVDSGMPDAPNVLPIPGETPQAFNLVAPLHQPALATGKRVNPSLPRPMDMDDSNPISPPMRSYDSAGPEITALPSTNVSSHLQYSNSLSNLVPTVIPRVAAQAPAVALPWQAEAPMDISKGLSFGIQTLRAGAFSPKGSQSGTDQSTSSGTTSDIPRDIESANTSIGSPVPPGLGVKETTAGKADDELSDTSMSLDSTHSPSPDGKERIVAHENHHQSEPSSPPYSPRLDAFMQSDQGSAPITDAATPQFSLTNGSLGAQTTEVSAGRTSSSPRKPSSTFLQCSKCGKRLLKVSTGGDNVLCGNCTNRETSQSRQSPTFSNVPVKSTVLQSSVTHIPQAEAHTTPANPFNTSAPPGLSAPGGLYLPRTNSYISSSTRRRSELTPTPGLLPAKRQKPTAVARKVASAPSHTYQASQINTSRPNMKKANELRTPEKAKQQNARAVKKAPVVNPESPVISSEIGLRLSLEESLAANDELQRNLESQKSALRNYASKMSALSDNLEDKERRNQELSVEAKKLNDQLSLKEKRIEELQKIEDENKILRLELTKALSETKQHLAENRILEEKAAQALNEKQQALKEKHHALDEKQQAMERSQHALMEKQQTYLELQEQQKLLRIERERIDSAQKRQESAGREQGDSPAPDLNTPLPLPEITAPAITAKPTVPYADLEYEALNPFEAYPNVELAVREIPSKPVAQTKPNSSRRFKKLSARQRLDFALMDRRFIHHQRPGYPVTRKGNSPSSDQTNRKRHEAESNRDPLDSSETDDSEPDMPIEELVGAPAEIMPTIQENGRLCFRDGALASSHYPLCVIDYADFVIQGANGKLPRAKIFHKVGRLDIAGQIR
ncbi:MAG: hypothetical protein M1839_009556 [Geoglossum umbratile]|nr:MAG: hypothetical protein M1839_009556 [Geoglossum umbratile]